MKGFLSDNTASVHPLIMESLVKANSGHAYPYGEDPYTLELKRLMKDVFGPTAMTTPVINGTGANVLGIAGAIDSYNSLLTVESAHINEDECGAFERITGGKIVTVAHENGKLLGDKLNEHLKVLGNFHHNQPKIISISQVTELGSVYTVKELKELSAYAHKNGLLLHMDGARLANACVSLGVSFKEMVLGGGIDILSFGGTKNGLMYGELIICFDEKLHEKLKYIRKQGMQLASKMRYISAQFLAYLKDDLCYDLAKTANDHCASLYQELKKQDNVSFLASVDANIIFAQLPISVVKELHQGQHFYDINQSRGIIRLVTSFDTTQDDIDKFTHDLRIAYARYNDMTD